MRNLNYNVVSEVAEDPIDRVENLKWALMGLPTVEDVSETHQNNDVDAHLVMKLNSEFVEPAIEEKLREEDAWMKPPEVIDSGGVEVPIMLGGIPDEEFENCGENQVRKRGGSKIIAIPPKASSVSDIDLGDDLDFHARSGEILIRQVTDSS